MEKGSEKSRPSGAPDAPHPWSPPSHPDADPSHMDDDVILNRLSKELTSVKKDIDLNYKRLYFKNPMIKPMLTMMEEQLNAMIKALDVPKDHLIQEEKKGFNFGVTEEDLA